MSVQESMSMTVHESMSMSVQESMSMTVHESMTVQESMSMTVHVHDSPGDFSTYCTFVWYSSGGSGGSLLEPPSLPPVFKYPMKMK